VRDQPSLFAVVVGEQAGGSERAGICGLTRERHDPLLVWRAAPISARPNAPMVRSVASPFALTATPVRTLVCKHRHDFQRGHRRPDHSSKRPKLTMPHRLGSDCPICAHKLANVPHVSSGVIGITVLFPSGAFQRPQPSGVENRARILVVPHSPFCHQAAGPVRLANRHHFQLGSEDRGREPSNGPL
jgi:hypothetical protein